MTQQKDIEEAVKVLHKIISDGFWNETVYDSHRLCRIKDLAQRYLEIEGFPEEKTNVCEFDPRVDIGTENRAERKGYNQAIQDCKLSLLKKMDGIEDIIKNCNKTNDVYDLGNNHCITKTNMTTDALIAQAIKDYITKG